MNPLTWIKANLQLAGAIAGSVILVVLVVGFIQDPFGFRHRHEEKLKDQRDTAVAEGQMRSIETKTIEHYHTRERIVTREAERSADVVQAIPSDDLPADVRSAWLSGLSNVHAAAGNDPGTGKP